MNPIALFMDVLVPTVCAVCSSPVQGGLICSRCSATRAVKVGAPHPLSECRSLGPYRGPLGDAVRAAKYGRNLILVDALGRWLGQSLDGWGPFDAVVPVPAPWTRRVIRGFDHGHRLARAVAQAFEVPFVPVLHHTGFARQVGRSASARWDLPDQAFVSERPLPGVHALLVDDVMTTGATMAAAARALKAVGVRTVSGVVIAHSSRQENNTKS